MARYPNCTSSIFARKEIPQFMKKINGIISKTSQESRVLLTSGSVEVKISSFRETRFVIIKGQASLVDKVSFPL